MGLGHSPQTITDNLVLYLDAANTKSYGGSGATWSDLSGNGTDGTISGATYSSIDSGYFTFNGVNTKITANSSDFAFGTGDYTVETWSSVGSTSGSYVIISNNETSSSTNNTAGTWQLLYRNGSFRWIFTTTEGILDSPASTITADTWNHIVATRSGTTATIYLNGVSQGTITWNENLSYSYLRIGQGRNGSLFLPGKVSAVKVYKGKALSESEIKQNFNALRGRYGI